MKKLVISLVTAAFALGSIGCGAAPKAKSGDAAAQSKPAKKSLKKKNNNRMEMAEEDE